MTVLLRGVLISFNAGTYLATVRLADSASTTIGNVPTDRDIAAGSMVVGRRVAMAVFDPANPLDAMILGVF